GRATALPADRARTGRLGAGPPLRPPRRVVLASRRRSLAMPRGRDGPAPTLYLHGPHAVPPPGLDAEFAVVPTRDGHLDLESALRLQAGRDINEVQVEAGPALRGALLPAGPVDELLLYHAPRVLGGTPRPA